MVNTSFPLLRLPIAVFLFQAGANRLAHLRADSVVKAGCFLACVDFHVPTACLDHPGCGNATSLRSWSREGFIVIQSQSL